MNPDSVSAQVPDIADGVRSLEYSNAKPTSMNSGDPQLYVGGGLCGTTPNRDKDYYDSRYEYRYDQDKTQTDSATSMFYGDPKYVRAISDRTYPVEIRPKPDAPKTNDHKYQYKPYPEFDKVDARVEKSQRKYKTDFLDMNRMEVREVSKECREEGESSKVGKEEAMMVSSTNSKDAAYFRSIAKTWDERLVSSSRVGGAGLPSAGGAESVSSSSGARRSPSEPVTTTRVAAGVGGRRGSLQLWQFLVSLLDEPGTGCIAWTGRGLEFKLLEPEEVARRWGVQKNRPAMNYDKLSRSLRYYYEKGIMQKVAGERYVYKFVCDPEALFNMAYVAPGDRREHTENVCFKQAAIFPPPIDVMKPPTNVTHYADMFSQLYSSPNFNYPPTHLPLHLQQYLGPTQFPNTSHSFASDNCSFSGPDENLKYGNLNRLDPRYYPQNHFET